MNHQLDFSLTQSGPAFPRDENLLEVRGLTVRFESRGQPARTVVDDVSFDVGRGRSIALVGESGSGKSVTCLAIMKLLAGAKISGEVRLDENLLSGLPESEVRRLCGSQMAMIFQEPMTALNPAYTVGQQICEAIRLHERISWAAAKQRTIELLRTVGIPSPEARFDAYPHNLSGGMRQRVMIAMSLSCSPKLLIADEPTTALDVTIQAQILELIKNLQRQFGTSVVFISHDLAVVAETCEEVIVLYAGQIVERALTDEIFSRPQHPYTVGLLGAMPSVNHTPGRLTGIRGTLPDNAASMRGCRFAPRCPFAVDKCHETQPALRTLPDGHQTRCLRAPLESLIS